MIKVAIPTHWRSDTILEKTLFLLSGLWYDITLFVNPKEQAQEYRERLWEAYKIVGLDFTNMWTLRNDILWYYNDWDKILMVDDDIWTLYKLYWKKLLQMTKNEVSELVEQWFWMCESAWYSLRWVYPSSNAICMRDIITYDKFIVWCFMGIIKSDINFDRDIHCKQDYDFTIQNIVKFWWAIRFENICTDNKYEKTKWWLQGKSRNHEESIRKLKQKRWGIIKDNPKRQNEILLNFKR